MSRLENGLEKLRTTAAQVGSSLYRNVSITIKCRVPFLVLAGMVLHN
jgi:hypothetical protein